MPEKKLTRRHVKENRKSCYNFLNQTKEMSKKEINTKKQFIIKIYANVIKISATPQLANEIEMLNLHFYAKTDLGMYTIKRY